MPVTQPTEKSSEHDKLVFDARALRWQLNDLACGIHDLVAQHEELVDQLVNIEADLDDLEIELPDIA